MLCEAMLFLFVPPARSERPGSHHSDRSESMQFRGRPSDNKHTKSAFRLREKASVLTQRLSYPTETVLSIKITRHIIVQSFKDSPRKPFRRRPIERKNNLVLIPIGSNQFIGARRRREVFSVACPSKKNSVTPSIGAIKPPILSAPPSMHCCPNRCQNE